MDKQRIKIIITCFLVIIFIFAWTNAIKTIKKKKGAAAKTISVATPVQEASFDILSQEESFSVREEAKDLEWLRCPFSGRQYTQESAVDLQISGIIWDEANPTAIINGEILGIGDSIGNLIVEKIEKQKVILLDGEKRIELNI